MPVVFINDRLVDASTATVPIADRGFLFGDGVFDTLRVQQGIPYRWGWHMDRLTRGLKALRMPPPPDLRPACEILLEKNKLGEGILRIYMTRGSGSMGYLPAPDATPTLVMETRPLPETPETLNMWLSGIEKISPRALPVGYKLAAQGLNATLARLEAEEHSCDEALQLSQEGWLSEATSASIFWLKDGTLYTPSLDCGCLEGSIRARLIELLDVKEGSDAPEALEGADAVFLTSASRLVQPVAALMPLGWRWQSAPHISGIAERLEKDVADYCSTHAWS